MDVFTPHPAPPQMTQMHILLLCTPYNPCVFKLTWTLLPPPNPTPTPLQMTHQPPLKASHAWMSQGNDLDDTRTDCQSCANIKRAVSRAREEFSQLTECAKFGHWLFSYFSWRKRMPSAYNIFTTWNSLAAAEIQCILFGPFRGNSHMFIPCHFSFPLPRTMFCTNDIDQVFCLDPIGLGRGRLHACMVFQRETFYKEKSWHTGAFTQRSSYTKEIYTQKLLHTDTSTDRRFYR